MAPTFPTPSATPAPAAAPIAAPTTAVPAAMTPTPVSAPVQPPAAGVVGQAPAAASVPPATPDANQAPPVDWEARARQIEAERNAERAQIQQGIAQLQAQQAAAQEQRAYAQRLQIAQSQAAQIAESDPARAIEFMNRFHEGERLNIERAQQARQQQQQMQFRQAFEKAVAPQYADHLSRQYNLPPDFAEQLRSVPGPQMDQMAQVFARQAQERAQWQALINQQQLTQQANQMQQSGAFTVGGVNAPAAMTQQKPSTNRRQRDADDYRSMLQRRAG